MPGTSAPRRLLWDAWRSTGWAAVGVGTGFLAIVVAGLAIGVAVASVSGIGLLLVRPMMVTVRALADLERRRLRRLGHQVVSPYQPMPNGPLQVLRTAVNDPAVRRDLTWLFVHATLGVAAGLLVLKLISDAVRDTTFPIWWQFVSAPDAVGLSGFVEVTTWPAAILVGLSGPVWAALWLFGSPRLLKAQAFPGVKLLAPHPDIDLSARVAQLTATRAAALDAHAVELRRIERALHDGAQNRLVGVAVLVGGARQAIKRDPAQAEAILERAQDSAEEALADLRSVVRSILPPVLENRGLEGAMTALASECAVPCDVSVEVPGRCPVSVEAIAYFAVAESLTNVSRHSGAGLARVEVVRRGDRLSVKVSDDGKGGADAEAGTGLAGILRRVEAHDGTVTVTSPPGGPTTVELELPCGS